MAQARVADVLLHCIDTGTWWYMRAYQPLEGALCGSCAYSFGASLRLQDWSFQFARLFRDRGGAKCIS
jgi:hypothetical protein